MRILLLIHPQLDPRKKDYKKGAEKEVWKALIRLGHQVELVGLRHSLDPLVKAIEIHKPQFVFNLLEEFNDEACFDFHPVSYLESLGIPFSGVNPRGLVLSRPKHIAKAIAIQNGFLTPQSFAINSSAEKLKFPLIVKLNREDASRGISQKNIVYSESEFKSCIKKMNAKYDSELIVETFIEGVDITVGALGNSKLKILPPWQLHLPSAKHISSELIKFSSKTRFKQGIRSRVARIGEAQIALLKTQVRALYKGLELSGYARFDFRLSQDGAVYFLEANANPNISVNEDFADSARLAGYSYDHLISEIVRLGRGYRPMR